MFVSSPDPSLTSHNLLATLDTVDAEDISEIDNFKGDLEIVLEIPTPKSREMKSQHSSEADYRSQLIEYYIKCHECAGWNHLTGKLLYLEQHNALEKVKGNVTADEGGVDDTY